LPKTFDSPVNTASIPSQWLPSPEHQPATPQQQPQSSDNQQLFQQQGDFVLYDQQQQQRRAPPPPSPGRTFNGNTNNLPVGVSQFYSQSAPNSSANLNRPRPQSTRPPVPLFNSTGNIPRQQPIHQNNMTDFAASFDGLDADFGAGFDASGSFDWETGANFTPVNNGTGTTSTSTVSPKDLFNDYMGSAPPSTAFTNLTSPDINASPYMASSSTEVSPMFHNTDDLNADTANWYSLFPEDGQSQSQMAPPMERHDSNVTTGSLGESPVLLDEHNFRRKSTNNSPGHGRNTSITGVSKTRRRKQPLQPIAVDANDKVALKRARNTLAARESRQRKLDHLGTLEARIKELEDREQEFKATLAQYGYNGPLMQT
jgi:hypothetical protein